MLSLLLINSLLNTSRVALRTSSRATLLASIIYLNGKEVMCERTHAWYARTIQCIAQPSTIGDPGNCGLDPPMHQRNAELDQTHSEDRSRTEPLSFFCCSESSSLRSTHNYVYCYVQRLPSASPGTRTGFSLIQARIQTKLGVSPN